MDEILHHLRSPGMIIPLQMPTKNGFTQGFEVARNGFGPQYVSFTQWLSGLWDPEALAAMEIAPAAKAAVRPESLPWRPAMKVQGKQTKHQPAHKATNQSIN